MGWLDHSTNNIILDAVLTDTGRQFLSANNGSFSITKFALGDDDVNYNIIKKYGRTVGREKIEKNTPIFEALTSDSQGQKYKLISVSNPNLTRLPNLVLTGESVDSTQSIITLSTSPLSGKTMASVTFTQNINSAVSSIDPELVDNIFIVELPNLFCEIKGGKPTVDNMQRATYMLNSSKTSTAQGGSAIDFQLMIKSIPNSLFTVYGNTGNKQIIKSYMRITGQNSGAVKDVTLIINKLCVILYVYMSFIWIKILLN